MKNNRNLRAFSLIEISIVVLIIGILIVGVTQSSRLVSQAKVNAARTLTQSSPASSVDGLVFWVESTSPQESFSNDNIEDEDAITIWNDINPQNSNRNNLAVTSAPAYETDGINGIPALTFTSDELTSSNFANLSTGNLTIFVVVQRDASLSAGTVISKASSTSAINFEFNLLGANTGFQVCTGDTTNGCYTGATTPASIANGAYVYSAVLNPNSTNSSGDTASGYSFFQNGAAKGEGTTATTLSTAATDDLSVGNSSIADNFAEGNIGEIIVYDRILKQEERQSVEEYLGKKWGIKMTTETY